MREGPLREQEFGPGEAKVRIDVDTIVDRIVGDDERFTPKKKEELREHYQDVLRQYEDLELTLPIDDEPMRRICQVLTEKGFITTDSCEGHEQDLPHAFFTCEDQQLLRELAHVLARASRVKRFPWLVRIWSADPYLNPDSPLSFIVEPSQEKERIDPQKDCEELLRDLDIIGVSLLDHFHSIDEEEGNQPTE